MQLYEISVTSLWNIIIGYFPFPCFSGCVLQKKSQEMGIHKMNLFVVKAVKVRSPGDSFLFLMEIYDFS